MLAVPGSSGLFSYNPLLLHNACVEIRPTFILNSEAATFQDDYFPAPPGAPPHTLGTVAPALFQSNKPTSFINRDFLMAP
jgi:hypothetical protein